MGAEFIFALDTNNKTYTPKNALDDRTTRARCWRPGLGLGPPPRRRSTCRSAALAHGLTSVGHVRCFIAGGYARLSGRKDAGTLVDIPVPGWAAGVHAYMVESNKTPSTCKYTQSSLNRRGCTFIEDSSSYASARPHRTQHESCHTKTHEEHPVVRSLWPVAEKKVRISVI